MKLRGQLRLREPKEFSRERHFLGIGDGFLIQQTVRDRHECNITLCIYTMQIATRRIEVPVLLSGIDFCPWSVDNGYGP